MYDLHISLEQIETSMEARKQPGVYFYPETDPGSTKQQDLFRSYQQGMDQVVTHYLNVKWSLFEQEWPDPARCSIAFEIEDAVQGIHNRAVRCSLDRDCVETFQVLCSRSVHQVMRERKTMRDRKSWNQSWHGLELQGDAFVPRCTTILRGQKN
ncbi:MAG: hypothetical protein GY696_26485 [Gammaproteobacteria bacterium]|nr:hypothetical protein [Gammaproteobacteria bacterium]